MQVKKGTILAITKGEYSDYYLMGHVKVLADFDTEAEVQAFKDGEPKQPEPYVNYFDEDKFVAYLLRKKLIKPHDKVLELYVGSYGRIDAEVLPPKTVGDNNV